LLPRARRRHPWSCAVVLLAAALAACFETSSETNSFDAPRGRLVNHLRARGITDARVLDAIGHVPRHEFMRPDYRERAYEDRPFPIGRGQTISQPYVVALMSQAIVPDGTGRVLEVGTGSGYQAAVLSLLYKEVYSIEIDEALADSARERLRKLGYANVQVRSGDGFFGWPEKAPFDAVIVTAATPRIPERLAQQLAEGGWLVAPVGGERRQELIRARKVDGKLEVEKIANVMFVPMTGAVRITPP
jgi:protein-L-isoaspartate(D-aspartate) O-methyltransferase